MGRARKWCRRSGCRLLTVVELKDPEVAFPHIHMETISVAVCELGLFLHLPHILPNSFFVFFFGKGLQHHITVWKETDKWEVSKCPVMWR